MTVKDIVDHCPDNKIKLRDYESGKIIDDVPICKYWEYKVVKFYARVNRRNREMEAVIVVMIRVNLDSKAGKEGT